MAQVNQFPGGEYPLGDARVFEPGEWPEGAVPPAGDWPYTIGDARVYQGADTGWPPPNAMPQDWLYTIGAWPTVRGQQVRQRPSLPFIRSSQAPVSRPRSGRRGMFRGFEGLGDDAPDAIRIYVPRLAAGLYAIDLYQTGLTPDAMPPVEPIATARWNSRLATKFSQEGQRLLGFVPVVHEPEGAEVIYAHMAGATSHTEAERIWSPMQRALNQARTATGVGAPADPYAGQPRSWETTPPAPSPEAPPVAARPRSVADLVLGIAMVVGGIVLF